VIEEGYFEYSIKLSSQKNKATVSRAERGCVYCKYSRRHRDIFSGSEPAKSFATSACNNLARDGISVVAVPLVTSRKVVRVKNPEDCTELSHQ
jgi:hypothetical protein